MTIILTWDGANKKVIIPGFPAHDLDESDLAKKLGHGGLPDTIDELKAQLIGTGLYKAVPKKKGKAVTNGND